MVTTRHEYEVFISFATEDRDIADTVADRLRRDGVKVWRYTDAYESGSWHLNQLRALRDSKLAVFVITPNSDASSACLDETQRVADPTQMQCVPLPLVVGAWDHASSDQWLLLSKWSGVIASPVLTEEALHGLIELVHDRLGFRPIAALSTGQALVAVKDELCRVLEADPTVNPAEILQKANALQVEHRGNMVAFSQFTYLDRELEAAAIIADPADRSSYTIAYLRAFFDQVVSDTHHNVATRLAGNLKLGDTIVVSEYSRVILQAFKILAETDRKIFQSLTVLILSRTGMLLVDDEPLRMRDGLIALGNQPITLSFGDWLDYLLNDTDNTSIGDVDVILFGVEAFSESGDVVYPQIVKELDGLRGRRLSAGTAHRARVIAAGESYKVCRNRAEVSKMIADPHYTVIPSGVIDLVITDIGEFAPDRNGKMSLRSCFHYVEEQADKIRRQLWPATDPLPVWNLPPEKVRDLRLIATDIDGTLTSDGAISVRTLANMSRLHQDGVAVLLVTGRSAGWAAGLAQYLPAIVGVVAENGAVLLEKRSPLESRPVILEPASLDRLPDVQRCLDEARTIYPDHRLGLDNDFRLLDRTIEVAAYIDSAVLSSIADKYGCTYTYSTVHHHFSASTLTKQTGLMRALIDLGLEVTDVHSQVLTVGDSPNDQELFDDEQFTASVGVRDVLDFLPQMRRRPSYVTLASEGYGFDELSEFILEHRGGRAAHG